VNVPEELHRRVGVREDREVSNTDPAAPPFAPLPIGRTCSRTTPIPAISRRESQSRGFLWDAKRTERTPDDLSEEEEGSGLVERGGTVRVVGGAQFDLVPRLLYGVGMPGSPSEVCRTGLRVERGGEVTRGGGGEGSGTENERGGGSEGGGGWSGGSAEGGGTNTGEGHLELKRELREGNHLWTRRRGDNE